MSLMLLCPGQGAQHPAMFDKFKSEPAASKIMEFAAERLRIDLRLLGSPLDTLDYTDNRTAQILLTTHCLAVKAILGAEIGDISVGYSVGEISAAACAGCYDARTAFELIEERVRCMDQASKEGLVQQGMLAVVGIPISRLRVLADDAGTAIAILNGNDHAVLGGPSAALDELEPRLKSHGAHNVKRLGVRVASHTRFIDSAAPAFAETLRRIPWNTATIPLLSGIDGRMILTHSDAVVALSEQLRKTLNFQRCLEMARERGASIALEIGPGHSLSKLTNAILPDLPVRSFEDFRSMDGMRKWIAKIR